MYRALTWAAHQADVDSQDGAGLVALLEGPNWSWAAPAT